MLKSGVSKAEPLKLYNKGILFLLHMRAREALKSVSSVIETPGVDMFHSGIIKYNYLMSHITTF